MINSVECLFLVEKHCNIHVATVSGFWKSSNSKDQKPDCCLEMISSVFKELYQLIVHNPFEHFGEYGSD